jgi:BASS family bile acid:Na+ symporter
MDGTRALTLLFNAGIAISIAATVLSLGMTYTVAELLAPLKRIGLVIAMVVTNAVVIPAVAWGIAKASPMSSTYVPGLALATLGMGSAGALKAAQLTKRADLALGVSVVVVLQLLNTIAVPVWAGQIVSGATLSAWDIVKSLLAMVLAPLVVGLVIKARHPDHATDWQPALVRVANRALVIALATGIAANWATIVSMFSSWVIFTVVVIIAVALAAGLLVGGRNVETRTTPTLVSGMRFASGIAWSVLDQRDHCLAARASTSVAPKSRAACSPSGCRFVGGILMPRDRSRYSPVPK